eukprot:m.146387 g.146387  ORF g.146387 m.146387 type:complete len:101 (-) comp24310_c1_seq5:3238-3540(-)
MLLLFASQTQAFKPPGRTAGGGTSELRPGKGLFKDNDIDQFKVSINDKKMDHRANLTQFKIIHHNSSLCSCCFGIEQPGKSCSEHLFAEPSFFTTSVLRS